MIFNALKRNIINNPHKVAAIYDGNKYTYEDIWLNSKKLAAWVDGNTSPQSRAGIMLDNSIEAIYAIYGITMSGRVPVLLDIDIHQRNLDYILNDASIELFVTSSKSLQKLTEVNKEAEFKILLVDDLASDNKYSNLNNILKYHNTADFREPESDTSTAVILYTTGSTGPKKGVELSHANLNAATININEFMQIGSWAVESLPMRLSHSFGFARLRCVFDVGGTVILENGLLRPERVLNNMKKYNANAFSSAPAGFSILLDHHQEQFEEITPNIKYMEIGTAFMRKQHKDMLMTLCPEARLCMFYGLTEASRATFIEFHSGKNYLHTVGKPSPNVRVKIVNDNGTDLGFNSQGEIAVRGDMVMKGYLNKEKLTKLALKDDWFHTGDLGMIDSDGYVHLLGRAEEIINVGGLKVAPGEVEEVLLDCPGITEAAVVGCKADNIDHATIMAFVVTDQFELDQFMIKKYCIQNLEPYKIPTNIFIVHSLPRTQSGKIQRHLLTENKPG